MKILVTGSSGQLGAATVKHLLAHGYPVTGIDITPAATTHHIIDINQMDGTDDITRGIDAVIHTAAIHGKHFELNYPREAFIKTNINGTLNLLNACVKSGANKFLYISTTSIYGHALIDHDKAVWVDEALPEKPRDIYDITKQTAEQLCRDFFYKEGLQTSVYRVGRFLPEEENLLFNHRLYRGLDVRDGAEALRLALGTHFKEFEIFNVSSGSPFTRAELMQIKHSPAGVIMNHFPQAAAIYKAKGWVFPTTIDRVYVSDKARQYFNYQPEYTFAHLLNNVNFPDK